MVAFPIPPRLSGDRGVTVGTRACNCMYVRGYAPGNPMTCPAVGGPPYDGTGARHSDRGSREGFQRNGGVPVSGSGAGGTNAGKRPNGQLGSWFVRSGWSKGELARQVNRRARQMGAHHISTDTSRVRRWLDGEQPREPIPRILSELFSERFGTVVPVEDLGLRSAHQSPSVAGVDLPWAGPQTVALLSEFSRSDLMLARRGFLGSSLALAAGPTLIEPMQRWLVPVPPPDSRRRNSRASPPARPSSPGPSWTCWSPPP